MKCAKCGGLLLKETFCAPLRESALDTFEGLKCTVCGDVTDPIILENRKVTLPMILGWSHNPDIIDVLIASKRYSYELPLYWIEKAEKMWKYAPWRALNLVRKNGRLRRTVCAHHRPKRKEKENAEGYQENA